MEYSVFVVLYIVIKAQHTTPTSLQIQVNLVKKLFTFKFDQVYVHKYEDLQYQMNPIYPPLYVQVVGAPHGAPPHRSCAPKIQHNGYTLH
jgi:hypothetical protein